MHIVGNLPCTPFNKDIDAEQTLVCTNFSELCNSYFQRPASGTFLIPIEIYQSLFHKFEEGKQHDAEECILFILDNLVESFSIRDKFLILQHSTVQCLKCNIKSNTKVEDLMLQLSIKPSLAQSLETFVEKETLSDDYEYFCSHCNSNQLASKLIKFKLSCSFCYSNPCMFFILDTAKQIEITETSEVLIVTLKRFRCDGKFKKIHSLVDFPLTDFLPYPSAEKYDLFCVVNHIGGRRSNSGHYNVYVNLKSLSGDNCQWYIADDRSVTLTTQKEIVTEKAYILFYRRQVLSKEEMANSSPNYDWYADQRQYSPIDDNNIGQTDSNRNPVVHYASQVDDKISCSSSSASAGNKVNSRMLYVFF